MNNYQTSFYYSPEDQAYIVTVPELPGCMADGKTIEEALTNAQENARIWINTAKMLGREIPEPYKS